VTYKHHEVEVNTPSPLVMAQLVLGLRSVGDGAGLCLDPEGLGPTSYLRELDFTPCFEQFSESAVLLIFSVFAGVRCVQLARRQKRAETHEGNTLLHGKLVGVVIPILLPVC
jgi:hypothetical protein